MQGLRLGLQLALLLVAVLVTANATNPFESKGRSLLATCEPLSFTELKPTVTHAPVLDLEWVGADDLTVFAITHKYASEAGGLWRSKDGGSSFVELTAKLNASISNAEVFSVMGVYSQKSHPGNVLLLGTGTYMWVSSDYGETLTPVRTPTKWRGSGIRSAKMHPRRDNWLLVLVKRPDCKSLDKAQMECPHDLMLNKDVFTPGSTWTNLTADSNGAVAGFVDFDWGASLCPSGTCPDLPPISDDLVLATMYARPGDYDQPWDPDVHFTASADYFKSFSTHVRCGNMFEVVGRSVYLAFANSCPTDINGKSRSSPSSYPRGITLFTSLDAGNSFTQACLPVALKQEGYELVETHDGRGAVVVVDFVVDTGFMDLPASSVYTAGPHHALFSLSLTDVYHSEFGTTTDFARVEGVPGIYIANQMLPKPPGAGTDPAGGSGSGGGGGGGGSGSGSGTGEGGGGDYYDLSDLTEQPLVETRITFNGGGHWQRIPAPQHIANPACDRCGGAAACYLHLHGLSAWDNMGNSLPAVYSNPSAPGLIMATGNVAPLGVGLDGNDGLCTWLSNDGGVTWAEVGAGAYIYEYADWGGLVVMARHPGVDPSAPAAAADEIRFSLDYGRCWQSVPLSVALLVDNVRIEPDGQRPRVILHGRSCRNTTNPKCSHTAATDSSSGTEGVMYAVDVAALMAGKLGACSGADYEEWTVPSPVGTPRCVLGEQLRLTRRKQDSVCLNGPTYSRPAPHVTPCNCTLEDTECDYGYIRDADKCVAISADRMPQCPVLESNTYTVSDTGRRLVHSDKCLNPAAIIPDTEGTGKNNKPASNGGSKGKKQVHHSAWFGFFIFGLVVAVLAGLFYSWWRFMASESQQDTVRELAGAAGGHIAALWGLLVDKIRSLRRGGGGGGGGGGSGEELGYFQPLGDPGHDVEGRGNIFTLK
ncbi:hypothetical protein HXX76_003470 [Chlamydomonas incerta]|uniref:VPS10 domain-containing protein n=1 Tax=Chlamydomonas incerta TaxID=51695 RepID=A0A835TAD5_CHLIN|nr:hypothetical protein HXX76_003470 [Chlamydomonas incerta]|eukprot:KAG2441862.1 hypothetical protein HXX76_003470 [Chlamydomonas incerta]